MLAAAKTSPRSPHLGTRALLALCAVVAPTAVFAQLAKATSAAESFQAWLWIIIPVLGLIAGGIIGLFYAFDIIRKETAYQWGLGIAFAGAIAGGVIKLLF